MLLPKFLSRKISPEKSLDFLSQKSVLRPASRFEPKILLISFSRGLGPPLSLETKRLVLQGRYRPSINLVSSLPVHRFSQVSFVEKSAGNSDLDKLMIEFFHLVERVSSTELWWDRRGSIDLQVSFRLIRRKLIRKFIDGRIRSNFPRQTLQTLQTSAFCKLSFEVDRRTVTTLNRHSMHAHHFWRQELENTFARPGGRFYNNKQKVRWLFFPSEAVQDKLHSP